MLQIVLPAGKYIFKVNNRNTRTRCEICSKLTIKTPERRQWRRSVVFIVNFEHIYHLVLVFLLLTLSRSMSAGLFPSLFSRYILVTVFLLPKKYLHKTVPVIYKRDQTSLKLEKTVQSQ